VQIARWVVSVAAMVAILAGGGPALSEEEGKSGKLSEPIQEFFLAETAYSQERGETQLTFSAGLLRFDRKRDTRLEAKGEYGITDRLQIEASVPYRFLNKWGPANTRGLGDVSAGLSWSLHNSETFGAMLGLEVGLPTGSEARDLGEGAVEWEPSLLIGRAFGKTQVHFGLSCGVSPEGREWHYDLAAVFPQGRFSPTLELNGSSSERWGALLVTPGAYYRLGQGAEFGIGVPLGASSRAPRFGLVAKLSFEF
jgi:hypothetical protein